jgi:hypothetical protein
MTRILMRLAVWLIETSFEALMLGLFPIVLFGYDKHAFGKGLLFSVAGVALMFFTTGYLLTAAIFRAAWRGQRLWSYPAIATALFFIHFGILNVAAGGALSHETDFASGRQEQALCLFARVPEAIFCGGGQRKAGRRLQRETN